MGLCFISLKHSLCSRWHGILPPCVSILNTPQTVLSYPQWRFRTSLLPLLGPQSALLSSCDMTFLVGNSLPFHIFTLSPTTCRKSHTSSPQPSLLTPPFSKLPTRKFTRTWSLFDQLLSPYDKIFWLVVYDIPATAICFLTSDHLNSYFGFFYHFPFAIQPIERIFSVSLQSVFLSFPWMLWVKVAGGYVAWMGYELMDWCCWCDSSRPGAK